MWLSVYNLVLCELPSHLFSVLPTGVSTAQSHTLDTDALIVTFLVSSEVTVPPPNPFYLSVCQTSPPSIPP